MLIYLLWFTHSHNAIYLYVSIPYNITHNLFDVYVMTASLVTTIIVDLGSVACNGTHSRNTKMKKCCICSNYSTQYCNLIFSVILYTRLCCFIYILHHIYVDTEKTQWKYSNLTREYPQSVQISATAHAVIDLTVSTLHIENSLTQPIILLIALGFSSRFQGQ